MSILRNTSDAKLFLKNISLILLITATSGCVEEIDNTVKKNLVNRNWVLLQQTATYIDEQGEVYDEVVDDATEGYLKFFSNGTFDSDGNFSYSESGFYYMTAGGLYSLEYDNRYIHFNEGLNEQIYWPEVRFKIEELSANRMVLTFTEYSRAYEKTFYDLYFLGGQVEAQEANLEKNYDQGYYRGSNYGHYAGFYENFTAEKHGNFFDAGSKGYIDAFDELFENDGNDFMAGFDAGYVEGYESGKLYAEEESALSFRKHGTVIYTYEFILGD